MLGVVATLRGNLLLLHYLRGVAVGRPRPLNGGLMNKYLKLSLLALLTLLVSSPVAFSAEQEHVWIPSLSPMEAKVDDGKNLEAILTSRI